MEAGQAPVTELPADVQVRALEPHLDDRGSFTELFRGEWGAGVEPVQWNAVRSEAGVLRGVHVHRKHDDYLLLYMGRATVGLRDLRSGSATEGQSATVSLSGESPLAITIPHGVAHGFLFHQPSVHIYAVSEYWDRADELGCHWRDPALGLEWGVDDAHVSPRDASLPPLAELLRHTSFPYGR